MPYKVDLVNGHLDLLHTITQFLAGWPDHTGITATLTGNPLLKYVRSMSASTPLETWTLVCTTGGGAGVAIFSVTGSVSGAQANATAGVDYQITDLRFKITGNPLYNCVVGDQFVFTFATGLMTTAAIPYVVDRYNNAYALEAEAILHGIGDGTQSIFTGLKSKYDVGNDIYNLGQQGYTDFASGSVWENQPGALPMTGYGAAASVYIPSIGFAKEPTEARLYLSANSRRYQGAIFFEGYSAPFYMGFLLPYFTPSQWQYPLFVAGSMGGPSILRYSSGAADNSSWFNPCVATNSYIYQADQQSSGRILDPGAGWSGIKNDYRRSYTDEAWRGVNNGTPAQTWPYSARCFEDIQKNIDDSYPLYPIYIMAPGSLPNPPPDSYFFGIPEGCFAISGFDNVQENTFTIGSDLYVVVRNSQYGTVYDYMAIRMDA